MDRHKNTSLLCYIIHYGCEKFYDTFSCIIARLSLRNLRIGQVSYSNTSGQVAKACQGQTLKPIGPICKLKKSIVVNKATGVVSQRVRQSYPLPARTTICRRSWEPSFRVDPMWLHLYRPQPCMQILDQDRSD